MINQLLGDPYINHEYFNHLDFVIPEIIMDKEDDITFNYIIIYANTRPDSNKSERLSKEIVIKFIEDNLESFEHRILLDIFTSQKSYSLNTLKKLKTSNIFEKCKEMELLDYLTDRNLCRLFELHFEIYLHHLNQKVPK